ncbi:substrate-binding domain-containing protein [Conexibacter sp. JD483]|uniref:substrate-binding domain-containing protein n=1 Tax=unclassified Conexibacter TaxID=2627773 RepID=UPI00271B2893|nr:MULTISPECIES: substrate-binding domain-containing protein [unclassified Conexibacter]MDO8188665.1 substrate-binding domain-containing protein [Conexibacter sp. CPCC 205706]MDO8199362.1 substrate-binding domain-containing protein [Conexibacter sp. CPCC 205762]MDR9370838.1 substrate-binding domain-containing protein [Conexibacter sp. JD483]
MGLLSTKRVASVLAAGAAVAALGTGVASASTYTNLVGEGASLQNLAQNSIWGPAYSTLSGGRTLTYTGNSSGAALASIGANATGVTPTHLEVYGSDDPPTATQVSNIRSNAGGVTGVEVIPVAQAAVAVIANLPTGCTGTGPLNASSAQVGRAFNSGASASDVFGTAVSGASCTTVLTPIARSTTSGTTLNFKNYIAQRGYGGAVDAFATTWTGVVRPLASSGGNLVSLVNTTKGSIGYANLADAISGGLTTTSTTAGFIANVDTIAAQTRSGTRLRSNCNGAIYRRTPTTTANADWNGVFPDLSNVSYSGYPICALTYVLGYSDAYTSLPRRSDGTAFTAAEGLSVAAYYQYITDSLSGQLDINAQNYAALPGAIQTIAATGAARIN